MSRRIASAYALGICLGLFTGSTRLRAQCLCPADMNNDVKADGRDISCFTKCLTSGAGGLCPSCACADTNLDTFVNLNDIPQFVSTILSGNLICTLTTPCYEPGTWETPPASPCGESSCSDRPDRGVANSVYLAQGEFYHTAVDLRIKGRGLDFVWARKYRSKCGPNTAMGCGWDFSYNIYIEQVGQHLLLHDGNSRQDLYELRANGKWARDEYFREIEDHGLEYWLVFADTGRWVFNPPAGGGASAGKLKQIIDRNGNTMTFTYTGPGNRLSTITDSLNRPITIAYNASNLISSVTDFTGRQVVYTYYQAGDSGGDVCDLKSVRSPTVMVLPPADHNNFPGGKTTVYTYSKNLLHPSLNHNLLTIQDPKGQVYLINSYHPTDNAGDLNFDRLISQQWGSAGQNISVVYTAQSPPGESNSQAVIKAAVTDRNGNIKHFYYDSLNRLVVARELTRGLRPGEPPHWERRWTYNADAMPTQIVHHNGNSTNNTYELDLDPNAARRSRGNLRQETRNPGPLGGDQASITETYTYETGFGGCGCGTNFVKTHTDDRGNTTTHTYDLFGNRTHTDHRLGGGVEDRTYNSPFGQVLTHTWPANGSGNRRVDTYSYYAAGPQTGYLQSEVVDNGGFNLTTQYEYDAVGNVVRMVHPNGADTLYTYNQLDQVVRELSREALPGIRFEKLTWYDANDNVIRADVENRDESGVLQPNTHFSMMYEYEILNLVVRTCQEKGSASLTNSDLTCASFLPGQAVTTEYLYDSNRNRVLNRSPEAVNGNQPDNTVDTVYDERDLVYRSIRANGSAIASTDQTDYDGNGNVTAFSQGLEDAPRVTTYAYDGYNRRTNTTDPMGNVGTSHYDANGNTTSQRIDGERLDAPGGLGNIRMSESAYIYDAMDRRTQQDIAHFDTQLPQNPIGDGFSTTQWTYANNSQVTSMTTDLPGHVKTYTYDTANRLLTTTDAKGNTVRNSYDADSNVIQTVEVDKSDLGNPDESFTTTQGYDPLDRLMSTTDNVGNTHQYFYDSRNNRVRHIDARGNHTRYEYDGLNRLTLTSRDMNGNQTFIDLDDILGILSWDDSSRLTSQTDDNGNTTSYSYDSLNRRTGTDYADCTTDLRSYDVHDNPTLMMDAVGTVVMCSYDSLDRLARKTITPGPGVSADTTSETYAYDGRSRLALAQDNDSLVRRGTSGTSGYDSLSNVLRETQQTFGGGLPRTIAAQYDGESNQTRLTHPLPGLRAIVRVYDLLDRPLLVNDDPPAGPPIATYAYLGPSRVEQRDYPKLNPAQTVRLTVLYDGIRRTMATLHDRDPIGAPVVVDHRFYDWDANSNKTGMHQPIPPPPEDRFYTYDAANRLIQSQVIAGGPPAIIDYALDGVGNRTNVIGGPNPGPYTMDPTLCEPGDFQMNQYTTTPFNPQRLNDANGNLTSIPGSENFIYDYRNLLVQYDNLLAGQTTRYRYDCLGRRIQKDVGGVITRFYYDGSELIEEQTGGNAVAATYVYSKGPHSRLQMVRGGQKYFYHEDDLGSVMKVTDSSGSVVEQYNYHNDYGTTAFFDQFGNPIPNSAIGNPWLFHAHRFDAESGLYWCDGRYLATGSGRYIHRALEGIWDGSWNLGNALTYAMNNPASASGGGQSPPHQPSDPVTGGLTHCPGCFAGGSKSDCEPFEIEGKDFGDTVSPCFNPNLTWGQRQELKLEREKMIEKALEKRKGDKEGDARKRWVATTYSLTHWSDAKDKAEREAEDSVLKACRDGCNNLSCKDDKLDCVSRTRRRDLDIQCRQEPCEDKDAPAGFRQYRCKVKGSVTCKCACETPDVPEIPGKKKK